tara:strand:+ start:54 stop:473 length:420 start_codon:yes stop_codon:yes gene_type:complete
MDIKNIHKRNSNYDISIEPKQKQEIKCTPEDCWCSYHDNPYDNYFYTHQLNPTEKYFWWIHQWKQDFQEIHEDCKKLGCSSFTDDYVKGVLDSVSPAYPLNTKEEGNNDSFFEIDKQIDDEIREWMSTHREDGVLLYKH